MVVSYFYRQISANQEYVYHIYSGTTLTKKVKQILCSILQAKKASHFSKHLSLTEIATSYVRVTPWSTNFVTILNKLQLEHDIYRVEQGLRGTNVDSSQLDPLTEQTVNGENYFKCRVYPNIVYRINALQNKQLLHEFNERYSLGIDTTDLDYYYHLFHDIYQRNPSNVEIYDLAQSNSEHSRHHFFRGKLVIDHQHKERHSLMDYIKWPLLVQGSKSNSVVAFCDDASAIHGLKVPHFTAVPPNYIYQTKDQLMHPTLTAETHNFPTGVAPFQGATTGTGGRIRDTQCIGKGGHVIAGSAGYCVANLTDDRALEILLKASDGASDYGNKFGEPIIYGFTRSYSHVLPNGETRAWSKPIMFTSGVGQVSHTNAFAEIVTPGDLIVKIGGPCYRIGIGGGSASSASQGTQTQEADQLAVQRGDPEMEQKMNRVIRTCVDFADYYQPVFKVLHDQGAGGNGNVLKEIVEEHGGVIYLDALSSNDESVGTLEKWVAEYQESNAAVISPENKDFLMEICRRENSPVDFVGEITDSKKIVAHTSRFHPDSIVEFQLKDALNTTQKKRFHISSERSYKLLPLDNVFSGVEFVKLVADTFSLVSVGSKRFLTNKVDRSVTGLIAQQQCVGPLATPVSNVAVVAQSFFDHRGIASAIGEQPIKAFLSPEAMARLTVGEMVTNIMWANLSKFEDIKCSGNWMWPAKEFPEEGYALYQAVKALSETLTDLGLAIDGGKDSLSMSTKQSSGEVIKCPRSLVLTGYCVCPNINHVITPDIKQKDSYLLFIDLSAEHYRLGGSALLQCYQQLGDTVPDMIKENGVLLKNTFLAVQELIKQRLVLAGHDRSDGGLITTVLEMAIAGNKSMSLKLTERKKKVSALNYFFNEELGIVLEIAKNHYKNVCGILREHQVSFENIGVTTSKKQNVTIYYNEQCLMDRSLHSIRGWWEHTSNQLECLQINRDCAAEQIEYQHCHASKYFCVSDTIAEMLGWNPIDAGNSPRVAIIREEGSNGDREMAAAFYHVGFEVHDVTMNDLIVGRKQLQYFSGVVFVGGFSFADVPRAAVGWYSVIKYNLGLHAQFQKFFNDPKTFSLGICNGFQLQILLELFGPKVTFSKNRSGRFESRFSTVLINQQTNSVMLRGLQGSRLGVWMAHGEGCVECPNPSAAPIHCVDHTGKATEIYPFNPNGSCQGVAGLCTPDGRHLGFFGHIERSFLKWQWPVKLPWKISPWLKCFQNLYDFSKN